MSSKSIVIVQMGLPPRDLVTRQGEPADWFARALGLKRTDLQVVHPERGDALPSADSFAVALVTGSWSMVTDRLDWSERTAVWLRGLIEAGKPLLGVCYGHQLMAHAMGGRVDDNLLGREQGTFPVTLTPAGRLDPLAATLPSPFLAHLSHAQSVLEVPAGAVVLAGTAHDPHQILRYGPDTWSCQFHPEFTVDILRLCLAGHQRRSGERPGRVSDPADVRDTPLTRGLLRRFVAEHAVLQPEPS